MKLGTLESNRIYNMDCIESMKLLPDECIDLIVTDPPYGIGIDEWDKKVDIAYFTKAVYRILKKQGFYAFFGQMPTIIEWINESNRLFQYKEHISWVKRQVNPPVRLSRGHEEIIIYSKGKSSFYNVKGRYEDVKVCGLMLGLADITGIQRYISGLREEIRTGKPSCQKGRTKGHKVYSRFNSNVPRFRSVANVNYTNVWSFLPANQKTYNKGGKEHPTQKPLEVMERLVEMLSVKNNIVLDPFLGSGTTAVACAKLGRQFIGFEISPEYCAVANERIKAVLNQGNLFK